MICARRAPENLRFLDESFTDIVDQALNSNSNFQKKIVIATTFCMLILKQNEVIRKYYARKKRGTKILYKLNKIFFQLFHWRLRNALGAPPPNCRGRPEGAPSKSQGALWALPKTFRAPLRRIQNPAWRPTGAIDMRLGALRAPPLGRRPPALRGLRGRSLRHWTKS